MPDMLSSSAASILGNSPRSCYLKKQTIILTPYSVLLKLLMSSVRLIPFLMIAPSSNPHGCRIVPNLNVPYQHDRNGIIYIYIYIY